MGIEEMHPGSAEMSEKSDNSTASTRVISADLKPEQQVNDSVVTNYETASEAEYPKGAKLYLSLLSLCFVVILGGLDFSIIGVAVPAMTQYFNTISDVAWYNVAYRLTACSCQFTWGQLYSLFSVRRVFVAAIVIFMVGSAISAAATSSAAFIVGRAITGVGSAGVLTGTFMALIGITPLRLRPIFISLTTGLESVAIIVAPILGGALTQYVSWRWCFYINLPIGGIVLVSLSLYLSDARPPTAKNLTWRELVVRLDILGALSMIASLTCLFMALSWAGTKYSWSSTPIIVSLVFFALCLVVFGYDQFRLGDSAALPPRLLKQRSVIAAALFSCCLNGATGVLQYYIPIYFQVVWSYSPAASGYMMLPVLVGFNVTLLLQGFLTSAVGYYTPFMILSSILTSVGAGLITLWTTNTSLALLIVYQAIFGCGGGLAFEVPQLAVQTVLPEADVTLGLSITLFAQNFGGALFISVAQQVFAKQILANLQDKIPGLSPSMIQNLGLVDLNPGTLHTGSQDIVHGLENAFVQTWYIAVALSCLTIIGSVLMEFRSVKEGKPVEENLETIHA
jgi:MFS family permease